MTKKSWKTDQDSGHYLATQTESLERGYAAQVVYKSAVRATLYGRDPDELRQRAHHFAACQGWRRATVTLT